MDCNWLLCPWISTGKNTGVGCHSLYQGIFLTQGSNPSLPHCRQILYHLSHHEERKPHINLYLYVCVCIYICIYIYIYITIYTWCFIIKDSTKDVIYLYFFLIPWDPSQNLHFTNTYQYISLWRESIYYYMIIGSCILPEMAISNWHVTGQLINPLNEAQISEDSLLWPQHCIVDTKGNTPDPALGKQSSRGGAGHLNI